MTLEACPSLRRGHRCRSTEKRRGLPTPPCFPPYRAKIRGQYRQPSRRKRRTGTRFSPLPNAPFFAFSGDWNALNSASPAAMASGKLLAPGRQDAAAIHAGTPADPASWSPPNSQSGQRVTIRAEQPVMAWVRPGYCISRSETMLMKQQP